MLIKELSKERHEKNLQYLNQKKLQKNVRKNVPTLTIIKLDNCNLSIN